MIVAKYDGHCVGCGKTVKKGDSVYWQPGEGVCRVRCWEGK